MSFDEFPPASSVDISNHPELATLSLLEEALHVTLLSLPAFRPEITKAHPDVAFWSNEPSRCIAINLLMLVNALAETIVLYRRVVTAADYRWRCEQQQSDDIPF